MKINVNDMCSVKLTESGVEWLMHNSRIEYMHSFIDYMHSFNKETQVLTTELWSVMYIFGEMLFMTQMNIPFENNEIEILKGGEYQ